MLYMPWRTDCTPSIQSVQLYDNMQQRYNITRVLTVDATFDKEGYDAYSPLFISYVLHVPSCSFSKRTDQRTCFAVSYGYVQEIQLSGIF